MTSERPPEERVDEHLERYPDASVPAIAGHFAVPPSKVRAVLDMDDPGSGRDHAEPRTESATSDAVDDWEGRA